MCDQKVFLAIFDQEKQRLVELCSEPEFNARVVSCLQEVSFEKNIVYERFTNDDIHLFTKVKHRI